MPDNFKSKQGATLAGHSEKWADRNRRSNSHEAGRGDRGSRNQGTGAAGKANTVASDAVDTSTMSPHEKLKYFNSLGLLNPQQKQQLQAMDSPKEEPKPAPKEAPKALNPVKELSDNLGRIFASKPDLIQGIVKKLQSVPKEELKDKAQAILDAMKTNTSTNPNEVFSTIMQAMEPKAQAAPEQPEQKPRLRSGQMSEEEFREVNDYLGAKFVNDIINQAKQYTDVEKALYLIDMAIENVDDVNDARAVRMSMSSAADDLSSMGLKLKSEEEPEDDIQFDDEESDYISDDNRQWDELINFFKADSPAGKDSRVNPERAQMIVDKIENRLDGDNLDKMRLAKAALDNAIQRYVPGEQSRYVAGMNAVFDAFKKYEAENGQKITPDGYLIKGDSSNGSTANTSPQLSQSEERSYNMDKEAYAEPTLEQGLAKFRKDSMSGERAKEFQRFLEYVSDGMKQEGTKPAMINKTLNHYISSLKDNGCKFSIAINAMTDNAEAYDPEYGSEFDHNIASFESGMESYDNGDITPHEEQFIHVYNKIHGK